jgi:hypothetical protein
MVCSPAVTGLLHAENGPHQPHVGPDVHFSLRYVTAPDSGRDR